MDMLRGVGVWLVIMIVGLLGITGLTIWSIVEFKSVKPAAITLLVIVVMVEIVKMITRKADKKITNFLNHHDEGPPDDSIKSTGSVDEKEGS